MPIKTKEKVFDFKIGADPEFIMSLQGRKVDAGQTMELMLQGKEGLTKTRSGMGYSFKEFGDIGWDGASSTGEVRPAASNNPKEVVNNLAGLFKAFAKHIKICDLSTISEYSSVGGHIHFEVLKEDQKWSNEKKNTVHRRLASFYLPILISENKTNLNLRIKQGYGTLADRRIEQKFTREDGSPGYTFEFRVPSAEWLTTPKIANATLAYMATIYNEVIHHPKSFSKFNDMVYTNDKQGDALQLLAIQEFDLLTDSLLAKAKKYIKTFEMYPQYKNEIEYILNPKQVIKDKQKADYNIALGWKLLEKSALPKKKDILSSKKKIQAIAGKKDFDLLKRVMNINYNNDTNVAMFAECLKDRVAAFNWKLKNNYFIFGMRKGINSILAKNMKNEYLTGNELIKTKLDKASIENLFSKMDNKFRNTAEINRSTTIDFTTGRPKDIRESIITIGIPYDMRIQEDVKPFLSFIWALEDGKMKITEKKDNPVLINDENLPDAEQGEIYKILTKKTEPVQEAIIDEGSHSLRNHQAAISQMVDEAANIAN